jgi:sugar transferase (PEP-CTERM system associated)
VVRLFSHFIPVTLLGLFVIEGMLLALTGTAARFDDAAGGVPLSALELGSGTLVFMVVMLGTMTAFGLYSSDLPAKLGALMVRLCLSFLAGLCVLSVVFALWPGSPAGAHVFGLSLLTALVLTLLLRMAFLRFWPRTAGLARRIVVLGTGAPAWTLDHIERNPHGGNFRIVGFLPLIESERHVPASRILPAGDSIATMVKKYRVDEIIIAVHDRRGARLPVDELLECKLRGVLVTELSTFYERELRQLMIDSISASWMALGDGFVQGRLFVTVKAIFDFTVSAALLLFALPVMLFTAICILAEDGGPVLYRQERVGKRGRTFSIMKFRSMRKDAEKDGQACWAAVHDRRVTRVGRVIRKLRIDELPQVINVLRGEMSFVGPRPERPCFVTELAREIPFYAVRHCVKPGITGWAQVRYSYSDSVGGAAEKLQYDLYYVKNHSLFLDIVIAVETVGVVLGGRGAR